MEWPLSNSRSVMPKRYSIVILTGVVSVDERECGSKFDHIYTHKKKIEISVQHPIIGCCKLFVNRFRFFCHDGWRLVAEMSVRWHFLTIWNYYDEPLHAVMECFLPSSNPSMFLLLRLHRTAIVHSSLRHASSLRPHYSSSLLPSTKTTWRYDSISWA